MNVLAKKKVDREKYFGCSYFVILFLHDQSKSKYLNECQIWVSTIIPMARAGWAVCESGLILGTQRPSHFLLQNGLVPKSFNIHARKHTNIGRVDLKVD